MVNPIQFLSRWYVASQAQVQDESSEKMSHTYLSYLGVTKGHVIKNIFKPRLPQRNEGVETLILTATLKHKCFKVAVNIRVL
jgi:hypothetical protein